MELEDFSSKIQRLKVHGRQTFNFLEAFIECNSNIIFTFISI